MLGTQRSGAAEAAAAQQEEPEADLPVSPGAAGGPTLLQSVQLNATTASVCSPCEEAGQGLLVVDMNPLCMLLCLAVTHHPSGGVICPTPPGERE